MNDRFFSASTTFGVRLVRRFMFLLIGFFLFFSSCNKSVFFDDVAKIDGGGWNRNDKARFEIEVADTAQTYMFFIHVRNDMSYRYSNLYIFMQTRFPNGNITRDTLECILADPTGKWLGKGSGKLRQNLILLNASLKFPLNGSYVMDIEQGMRDEVLTGISDIGIRIEKNPN
ncbi:MAG: hypothetical protein CVT92_05820 [Bacteroidetes bacterium HGW-Bacteroidetes-1]|jgi:gliding motility-associated lipoprotein GldH|nr:MAG: hypothetical protein CVT92_05820 [Bacteroidetes bacterium HGW-Bacteroidetes-1]